MIIYSLLCDGGLCHSIERNTPQVVFTQGEEQLDYLMFKRSVLGQLAGKMCEGYSGYRPDHKVYQLPMKIVDELWPISAEMVVIGNRLWEPTDRFISWIDIQALAFWFADDGSISRNGGSGRPSANIHTSMMSLERHEALAAHLKRSFSLDVKPIPNGKGSYKLAISTKSTERLFEMIGEFSPVCMSYKVPTASLRDTDFESKLTPLAEKQPDVCVVPIRSIESVPMSGKTAHVFDIEVQDNHNYITGNMIVSNCSMMPPSQLQTLYEGVKETNAQKGMQVDGRKLGIVLTGDFLQLPPVYEKNEVNEGYVFRAECWPLFAQNTVRLTKIC